MESVGIEKCSKVGIMEKLKNSPFFLLVLGALFTLIMGSYAFTYSESGKTVKKDMFNMFLIEYRADTDRMFKLFEGLKE